MSLGANFKSYNKITEKLNTSGICLHIILSLISITSSSSSRLTGGESTLVALNIWVLGHYANG